MDEQQNASKSQPRLPPAAACRNLSRQISIEGGAAQQQKQQMKENPKRGIHRRHRQTDRQ